MQFLSVIAHELAHLELKHFNQQVNKQADIQGLQLLTLISSIFAAQYSINMGEAILASGLASAQTQSLSYSRALETEADRRATSIMIGAGYPPNSVYRMLNSLMRQSLNTGDAAPEYFRTHPLSESRVADSLKLDNLASIKQFIPVENSVDFELILQMLTNLHGFPAARESQAQSKNFLAAKSLIEIDRLISKSQFKDAKMHLDHLSASFQSEVAYQIRLTHYFQKAGFTNDALELVTTYLALKPASVRLRLLKAKLLKEAGQITSAVQILRELASGEHASPWLWGKTLEYAKLGDNSWAQLEAQLHYRWLSGENQATLKMIENNIYSDKWTAVEKSRLKDWYEQFSAEIELIESIF